MTPGARVAAAITILDQIQGGTPAEQALTTWARGSRFAGSKDRAAVRDHVFAVLRAKRSLGDGTGRALMQRCALREGWDIDALFSGEGHAPAPVTAQEQLTLREPLVLSDAARCNMPDWLWPLWQDSLGDAAAATALVQQGRADVFLRVNLRRCDMQEATRTLADDDIDVVLHPTVEGCLRVTRNARRVKAASAYQAGLVELQDAASQQAVRNTPVPANGRVLDFCAGGGGKALAFADQHDATILAHDIAPRRLRDLAQRASRAGVSIKTIATEALADASPFDVVFCDAPCSGSGTWRRTPDAKWRFTEGDLQTLIAAQMDVLRMAAPLVKPGGLLVYATCSVLRVENEDRIAEFTAGDSGWRIRTQMRRLPDADGDGFFTSHLTHG